MGNHRSDKPGNGVYWPLFIGIAIAILICAGSLTGLFSR